MSQLELARKSLASQNEPTLINNPTKYIIASLTHDHNPQPAKEQGVHNVDRDIEFVEFPTCMVGSVWIRYYYEHSLYNKNIFCHFTKLIYYLCIGYKFTSYKVRPKERHEVKCCSIESVLICS
jgi:hypothetical protein